MCFMAGANAVFTGDQMLTTPCELFPLARVDPMWLTRLSRLPLGRGTTERIRGVNGADSNPQDKAMMGKWGLEGMASFAERG